MFSISELVDVLGARDSILADQAITIKSVSVDSRQISNRHDTLFVAINGQRTDGHRFVEHAYQNGVRSFVLEVMPGIRHENANYFMVESSVSALQRMAAAHRARYDIPVIGITGSNGKTIVKEWLAQMLSEDLQVVRSPRSYNSQIGVPLSVLNMGSQHQVAIFEAGISEPGEMQRLQQIIQPTIGILTYLGDAHDAGFSDNHEKLIEKCKLFSAVDTLCINGAIDGGLEHAETLVDQSRVITWGINGYHTLAARTDASWPGSYRLSYRDQEVSYQFPFHDAASVSNVLAGIAAMLAMEYALEEIVPRLARLTLVEMRLELIPLPRHSLLINDAYSFDLASLRAGLETLNQHATHSRAGLILSDMDAQHAGDYDRVAELIKASDLDFFWTIGGEVSGLGNVLSDTCIVETFKDRASFVRAAPWDKYSNTVYLLKGARRFELEVIPQYMSRKSHSARLEIDLNAILRNLQRIAGRLDPHTDIIAMVKASGYGSGNVEIARFLEYHGVKQFGVAYPDEGMRLRDGGITAAVLVLNTDIGSIEQVLDYRLQPEVYDMLFAEELGRRSMDRNVKTPVHLKLNTGMNRLGFDFAELAYMAKRLAVLEGIEVASIFSHLAAADNLAETAFSMQQIRKFEAGYDILVATLGYRPARHILNTSGTLHYPEYHYDAVRIGIGMYGIGSDLEPTHRLAGKISQLRYLAAGDTVGYGRAFTAPAAMRIATVNVGYADGLPRSAGNQSYALMIRGVPAVILGNVCMDMCMVDVTHIDDVALGDDAEVFGSPGSLEKLAETCGTIPYEILTSIQPRVHRLFKFD